MDELRKIWRLNWLSAIQYIASIKDQNQHWTNFEQNNPHWSFVEIMCEYFDDLDLNEGYDNYLEKGFVTKKEVAIVANLHNQLDIYEPPNKDEYDHEAILKDPTWISICKEAKRTCKKLMSVLSNPEELSLMYNIN